MCVSRQIVRTDRTDVSEYNGWSCLYPYKSTFGKERASIDGRRNDAKPKALCVSV
jgi:hypothetical protein